MDRLSTTSEHIDTSERAVSSEPSSARPNPFDDDEDPSARKRRRTSNSGSPSRYLDALQYMPTSTLLAGDAATFDAIDMPNYRVMSPQTPSEYTVSQTTVAAESPPSKLTVNLRKTLVEPTSTPNSSEVWKQALLTPCCGLGQVVLPSVELDHDIESLLAQSVLPVDTLNSPPASPNNLTTVDRLPNSTEAPVALMSSESDTNFRPEVAFETLEAMQPSSPLLYADPNIGDEPMETIDRLIQLISTQHSGDGRAVEDLAIWIDCVASYLAALLQAASPDDAEKAINSYRKHRAIWMQFVELVGILHQKKWVVAPASPNATDLNPSSKKPSKAGLDRQVVFKLYTAFARMAAAFVALDFESLSFLHAESSPALNLACPELASSPYVNLLRLLVQEFRTSIGVPHEFDPTMAEDASAILNSFHACPGGHMNFLLKFVQRISQLIPTFPRLIEFLGVYSYLAGDLVQDAFARLYQLGDKRTNPDVPEDRLALGYSFFLAMDSTLNMVMAKHVTLLSNDVAQAIIFSLTDIYHVSLFSNTQSSNELVQNHRSRYCTLSRQNTQEVVAYEWRFDHLRRLIMSGQMQLRVMAVATICNDLVQIYHRFQDDSDKLDTSVGGAFLCHFARFLLDSKLAEYIIGPTCHPEIAVEGANIIGFLIVTRLYGNEQTDLQWQTITSAQDPRVSDALIRVAINIVGLYDHHDLLYVCEKLQTLPAEQFTAQVRQLCGEVFKHVYGKFANRDKRSELIPFYICLRLLRESLVHSSHAQVAHPDVYHFASTRLRELAGQWLDPDGRQELCVHCLDDIAAQTPTTLGSISCLWTIIRPLPNIQLHALTTQQALTKLLIDELEHAIAMGVSSGFPAVLGGGTNSPRRDLIAAIVSHESDTITDDLGLRLWDILVGPSAACPDNRTAGWQILNGAAQRQDEFFDNPYLLRCFTEYFPQLPSHCFCEGALEFLRTGIIPRVNDTNEVALTDDDTSPNIVGAIVLDDDRSISASGIEQLWRIVLTSTDEEIANAAMKTIVKDIYIDSKCIRAYPHQRARDVHLVLVNRCLKQLADARIMLQAFSNLVLGSDDEPPVIAAEDQIREQERTFTRSLALVRIFLEAHQSGPTFGVPDLRAFMHESPSPVEGESAGLKYQAFDDVKHTPIQPLNIGNRNTAASLLATLRVATGFDNYRVYFRGAPFTPTPRFACRTLEELHVLDGLLLVKKDAAVVTPIARIKPGSSALENEILTHFKDLWECLNMDGRLAQEIYQFLIKLPAHDLVLRNIESFSTSHKDIFPASQPYKCLYAIYALRECTVSSRRSNASPSTATTQPTEEDPGYTSLLQRALSLTISAISDEEIINLSLSTPLQILLSSEFMNLLLCLLQEAEVQLDTTQTIPSFEPPPVDRLNMILLSVSPTSGDTSSQAVSSTFSAITYLCFLSPKFWSEVQENVGIETILETVLLDDPSTDVRCGAAKILEDRILESERREKKESLRDDVDAKHRTVSVVTFTTLLWEVVLKLIPRAAKLPRKCREVFQLAHMLQVKLLELHRESLDLPAVAVLTCRLLLEHKSTEVFGQTNPCDIAASGLVKLLHLTLSIDRKVADDEYFPRAAATRLFWKHMFPKDQNVKDEPLRTLFNPTTRSRLYEIILSLISNDPQQILPILRDLEDLVPFFIEDAEIEDPYLYEIPFNFERAKSIRSACGYVGLKNLSNTCYLNSLMTQLFMNLRFRRFIIHTKIQSESETQKLLFQTQNLFSFLQESYQRFIDPSVLVNCIKTYDDTLIDIHNQMDVDEFYNLLFDRWESQLVSAEERKVLRSFYGGQLVQQVRSKECEHVSERLDTFQSIQCDIKGKSTLEESLETYVDGESMEGENKYKCTSCDRHVDAVKRTCLKNIPDNIIFHLKRFDFNLRTLQRSKINARFSFPKRVNMTPYTIEYLSMPTASSEEDIFELVGVLVHSGTAESGHYYSYIRERPSTKAQESWIEFNDELVAPWDPALLESSTFGGPESRTHFDNNGASISYDKTYSAYMLFYQRSSSLRQEQETMIAEGVPTPLRVQLSPDMAEQLESDNATLVRRHCLFDPCHIGFVENVLKSLRKLNMDGCSPSHQLETVAMDVALGHLDQVVSRKKDMPDFHGFIRCLLATVSSCSQCAFAAYEYFAARHEVFRRLLQRNPDQSVRLESGELLLTALVKIKENHPRIYAFTDEEDDRSPIPVDQLVIKGVALIFNSLWNMFHIHIRSWNEYFATLLKFARLGDQETAMLLSEDYLFNVMRIIWADSNMDLPSNYARMVSSLLRRQPRVAAYESIIMLIHHFMSVMEPQFSTETIVEDREYRLAVCLSQVAAPLPWTSNEISLLHQDWDKSTTAGSYFVEKIIKVGQARRATEAIVLRLLKASRNMSLKVFHSIRANISTQTSRGGLSQSFLDFAILYCVHSEYGDFIESLFHHICLQAKMLHIYDARVYFDFHESILAMAGVGTNVFAVDLYDLAITSIPDWAPSVLGLNVPSVQAQLEKSLEEHLFQYGRTPGFKEDAGGPSRARLLIKVARTLGFNCLLFLRDRYVDSRLEASREVIAPMQRVINVCSEYYASDMATAPSQDREYIDMKSNIWEAMGRLLVDDVEDEGSDADWDNSGASSDQMDELTDLNLLAGADD